MHFVPVLSIELDFLRGLVYLRLDSSVPDSLSYRAIAPLYPC